MAGLNKEIWLSILMRLYQPKNTFLGLAKNFSAYINNNTINFAEINHDIDIHIDRDGDMPVKEVSETPLTITLKTYQTDTIKVPYLRRVELSYDKMASIVESCKEQLLLKQLTDSAYEFSPSSNSDKAKIILTTGTDHNGYKRITEKDILNLSEQFDYLNVPKEKRVIVLHAKHYNELLADSEIFRTQMMYGNQVGNLSGQINKIFGFDVRVFTNDTLYDVSNSSDLTTVTKLPQGTAIDTNKGVSSFAFCKDEVGYAIGETKVYLNLADATMRADRIGFDQRFVAKLIRDKYVGAIVSNKA